MRLRQKKVSETIKKAVAEIILHELSDPRVRLAAVTRVEVSADLLHAKVYVSIIGEEAEQRTVFRGIQSAAGYIRNELGRRVKLRFLPNLQFIHDQSLEKAFEVSKLIDELAEERRERETASDSERPVEKSSATAPVVEIFSSIQGEGLRAGERHCFVRLAGCNLACGYCDTAESRKIPETARIERRPARRDFHEALNPLGVEDVLNTCLSLDVPPGFHRAAAITGGEPLLHADFLDGLLARLKDRDWTVLLETNGTLPDALEKIIRHVDVVSMDIKLESAAGVPADLETNRRFLETASQTGVYVKLVVVEETSDEEIAAAAETISAVSRGIPAVIQPCTKPDGKTLAATEKTLERLKKVCNSSLTTVEIIPQMHRLHSIP